MNKHSNILKIPQFFDFFKDFLFRIKRVTDHPDSYLNGNNRYFDNILELPTQFAIETLCKEERFVKKSIEQLNKFDERFIINLNIVEVFPNDVNEFIYVHCSSCNAR